MYYRQILERMGLAVDSCASAEDAALLFAEQPHDRPYDLVITDYVLSGVGAGFSVIRAVRESVGKKAQAPILANSSFKGTARKIEVLRNGANDFVAKPVVAEELEVRVSNLLKMLKMLKMQKMLRQLESQHDAIKLPVMRAPLTSLSNRSHLNELMPNLIADAHETARQLALLVFDLDHFKQINDIHGYVMGDQMLELVANTLQAACRSHDLVARVGVKSLWWCYPALVSLTR